MTSELEWKIKNLPDSPGCYMMKSAGEIIYVGKAKNLKNRVRQYFHNSASHTPKVRAMVEKVDDFDIVLVDGELEALMLECNLIKQYMPHYNILLKDDKAYPFIKIDLSEPFPSIQLCRKQEKDGAKYFGPYIGASAVREVMDTVRSVLPVRHCTKKLTEGMSDRPCLHHQTGQCPAPCAGRITKEEYAAYIQQVIRFLSGHPEDVLRELTSRMLEASQSMNYERAAVYRDKIKAVNDIMQKQKARSTAGDNKDIIAFLPCMDDGLVQLMRFSEGKLLSSKMYTLEGTARDDEAEVLTRFITQVYDSANPPSKEVLVSVPLPEGDVLEQLLTETAGHRIHLYQPVRGDNAALVRMAQKNLKDEAIKISTRREKVYARTQGALKELAEVLGLDKPPRRIEGYDISNTQGVLSVSSEVVMIDGVCARKEYRHFRIKSVTDGPNDFQSMYETIFRRLTHGLNEAKERREAGLPLIGGSFSDLPDLILIDGGRGQLNYAQAAMKETGLYIPMFGLAKSLDEIVLPEEDMTILLDRHSPALHLIEVLRDEAHRFGITLHTRLRDRHSIASGLEQIPGVGPRRRKALLTRFKTVEELLEADVSTIATTEGIGDNYAEKIYAFLHSEKEKK